MIDQNPSLQPPGFWTSTVIPLNCLLTQLPASSTLAKDYGFNQIGNLIAGRGERPFAPTEEWRSYLILIPKRWARFQV